MTPSHSDAPRQTDLLVPLSKLKKSPRNARRVPHSAAAIEALAASIAAKGLLQNLVVEPEVKDGAPTGAYFVTAGEGRRLALLLRVKRKEIRKSERVRCLVDTASDPAELSLDENVSREAMHPADEFEAFRDLADRKGWGAEEIAARFGVTARVVRQRLRLGAVSPRLLALYRDGDLTLDQMMAFAITEDHARQEAVYDALGWNRDPRTIRRELTAGKVAASDKRARFVGEDAYREAGGVILRDLFSETGDGYFEDAALLDRLALDKLRGVAGTLCDTEGWKWADACLDFPQAHGLRRVYPHKADLSEADQAALQAACDAYDTLVNTYSSDDDMVPEDVERAEALDAEIERLTALQSVYDPDLIARAGAFVVLAHGGTVRIERGFVRREDEPRSGAGVGGENEEAVEDVSDTDAELEEEADAGKGLPDTLVRDLTAWRTLGLRAALSEQPELARMALLHALVCDLFYTGEQTCLDIRASSSDLSGHADGIADSEAGAALETRHAQWAAHLPESGADLWGALGDLGSDARDSLMAHCVAQTLSAVRQSWERRRGAVAFADTLAKAAGLDMRAVWRPTAKGFFSRVTKTAITSAVEEAVSAEAAARIAGMKKADMANAAETLVAPTRWLPTLLRTENEQGKDEPSAVAAE